MAKESEKKEVEKDKKVVKKEKEKDDDDFEGLDEQDVNLHKRYV